MKIYTKKGDEGITSLIGGTRVSKSSIRLESYGTIDELNSYLGWVSDLCNDETIRNFIIEIQNKLFTIGSHLAADPEKSKMELPNLVESDVEKLEKEIDRMNESLSELKFFILPGGHPSVSVCHVSRCVCRRAERAVVHLSESHEVEKLIIKYLNRLSDYLFVLARLLAKNNGITERPWNSRA